MRGADGERATARIGGPCLLLEGARLHRGKAPPSDAHTMHATPHSERRLERRCMWLPRAWHPCCQQAPKLAARAQGHRRGCSTAGQGVPAADPHAVPAAAAGLRRPVAAGTWPPPCMSTTYMHQPGSSRAGTVCPQGRDFLTWCRAFATAGAQIPVRAPGWRLAQRRLCPLYALPCRVTHWWYAALTLLAPPHGRSAGAGCCTIDSAGKSSQHAALIVMCSVKLSCGRDLCNSTEQRPCAVRQCGYYI